MQIRMFTAKFDRGEDGRPSCLLHLSEKRLTSFATTSRQKMEKGWL